MVVLRHKKILELAKGFRGRGNSCYKIAVNRVEKALQYAYRDRKVRKREFRSLWIQRINASVRMFDLTYGNFIFGAQKSNIELDRKILADLAVSEPLSFRAVVDTVKTTSGIKK